MFEYKDTLIIYNDESDNLTSSQEFLLAFNHDMMIAAITKNILQNKLFIDHIVNITKLENCYKYKLSGLQVAKFPQWNIRTIYMHTLYDDLLNPDQTQSEIPIFLITKDEKVILLYKNEVMVTDINPGNIEDIEKFIINIFKNWNTEEDIRKLIPSYVNNKNNKINIMDRFINKHYNNNPNIIKDKNKRV